MPAYRFTYPCVRVYPAVPGPDGRSLIAEPGQVYELDEPLNDGCWSLVGITPETPPAGPEPAPEPVTPALAPEPAPVVPEPAAAPVVPPQSAPMPFYFPGFQSARS